MNNIETAWLAGIIEGEGTIHRVNELGSGRIAVLMTDRDVIDEVYRIAGVGQLYPVPARKSHHKDGYMWTVTSKKNIRAIADRIAPFLMARRREQLNIVLKAMDAADRRRVDAYVNKTHCNNGHELVGENLRLRGRIRICRACARAASARSRSKKEAIA